MPRIGADRATTNAGLYDWLAAKAEAAYAAGDPRCPGRILPVPYTLQQFRDRQPVEVAAWQLGGHDARAAGYSDALPRDRSQRARIYRVLPDDRLEPA